MKYRFVNLFLLVCCLLLAAFTASAQQVRFVVGDGMDDSSLKEKINTNVSLLLSEINNADNESRALELSEVDITAGAVRSLGMLWRNSSFRCGKAQVTERIVRTYGGFQLRNIPVEMKDLFGKVRNLELVIDMDSVGTVTQVNFAIESDLYPKVIPSGSDGLDLRNRQRILDYTEQFRTSFNRKDINFLELFFCEDALIVTGRVVRRYVRDQAAVLKSDIEYSKTSTSEFLAELRRVFPQAKYIQSYLSDIQVTPLPEREGFYGVLIKMGYASPIAFDEGYVFMLWDISDESRPQVLVRTWQPSWLDATHTRPLEESRIINVDSFDFKLPAEKPQPSTAPDPIMQAVKVQKAAPKTPLWTLMMPTFSFNQAQSSYGLMLGLGKKNGGFIHAKTDFHFGLNPALSCDADGIINGVKGWFSGEPHKSRFAITAGYLRQIVEPLYAYAGGGYGRRILAWEMYGAEDTYDLVRVAPNSFTGFEAELGLIFRRGNFAVSAGVQTNQFTYYEANVGIGVMF